MNKSKKGYYYCRLGVLDDNANFRIIELATPYIMSVCTL